MKTIWLRPMTLALIFCLLAGSTAAAQPAVSHSQAPLAAATASDPGDAFNWWIMHADAPLTFKNMTPHSLGISSSGVIHVVYGGDHLYHAWKYRNVWTVETVDPAWGVGSLAALAIDSENRLHVSYIDSAANRLKYATKGSGSWQIETPSIAASLSVSNAAIAVDQWNDPHIVFYSNDGTLRYGYYDSDYGAWVGPETLATNTGLLDYPGAFALAVVNPGTPYPHVSYHKHISPTDGSLYYTTRTNFNTWTTPLDLYMGGDSDGDYNDIALVGSIPHIAASSNSPGVGIYDVAYRFLDVTSWHDIEHVAFAYNNATAEAISLRLVSGVPYIAYRDPGSGYYWLNRTGDNTWTTEEAVATGSGVGSWASFAWYNSYPHATYYDSSTRNFSFKYKNSGGWQAPYTLATNGDRVGDHPALAVDALGRSHITHGDATAQQLLYIRYDGASWSNLTVDAGPVYSVSALALENNLPRVLYFGKDGTVRYAAMLCAPVCGFLSPETVDSGLSSVNQPALAIHASTGVQAAYNKNGSLIYAVRTGANTWSKVTVDSGISGMVSMALDSSGQPRLLYRKGSDLAYAYKDTSWHTGGSVASGGFGLEYSLRISAQGEMAAAYILIDNSLWNVTYSSYSCILQTCNWVPHTVGTDGDEFIDLTFDSKGVPHIAYFGYPSADLKLAERSGGTTWITRVIDSRGWVGEYPAIAISPLNGRARIAYPDSFNEDLKLALEGELEFLPVVRK